MVNQNLKENSSIFNLGVFPPDYLFSTSIVIYVKTFPFDSDQPKLYLHAKMKAC